MLGLSNKFTRGNLSGENWEYLFVEYVGFSTGIKLVDFLPQENCLPRIVSSFFSNLA